MWYFFSLQIKKKTPTCTQDPKCQVNFLLDAGLTIRIKKFHRKLISIFVSQILNGNKSEISVLLKNRMVPLIQKIRVWTKMFYNFFFQCDMHKNVSFTKFWKELYKTTFVLFQILWVLGQGGHEKLRMKFPDNIWFSLTKFNHFSRCFALIVFFAILLRS